ncbi:hypothetical protein BGW38_005559 [Lunasporangiospora selenospora]|uniref:J domain-containing protein n=1 Tax=Lunasporangiospora selenospora TaxID=979761 RepID=A0A9P6KAS8_9FUNG|nr:hypothetical protein BGW38_005559 [Lunasporangiospora selenospora]
MGPTIIESRKPQYLTAECIGCNTPVEFLMPKKTDEPIYIECYACKQVLSIDIQFPPKGATANASSTSSNNSTPKPDSKKSSPSKPKKVTTGTDANPLETELYEILGVPTDATAIQIKKNYRQLALQNHPDKNPDPDAHEKFQKISEAYQILSDPKLRSEYNMYGHNKDVSPEGGFVNPEAFFKQQFGGDRFVDFIGEISIGRDMRDALNEPEESTVDLTPEEKAKREASANEVKDKARDEARQARVDKLVKTLVHRLNIYTEGPCDTPATKAYQEQMRLEAEELKTESYGVELLHAIGFTYTLKAKQHLGRSELLGLGGIFHGFREKGHILTETVSTLRAAMDLQQSFSQLQEAEEKADEVKKKQLEEAAATMGLRALWKGSKLEVEGVLRDVCETVLSDSTVPKAVLIKRATALKIIGAVFEAVKPDPQPPV